MPRANNVTLCLFLGTTGQKLSVYWNEMFFDFMVEQGNGNRCFDSLICLGTEI